MTKETKKKADRRLTKKEAKKEVYEKLDLALSTYKNGSGSTKKFEKKLKKASKLFVPYLLNGKPAHQN
jgi:hypothetical protein